MQPRRSRETEERGLLAAGPLIASVGYSVATLIYAGLGLAATFAIGYRWRQALWH